MSRHKLEHHYGGWRPSLPDHRRRHADPSGIKVLPEVDPRGEMPAVFNQWALGSCTIHAAVGAFMYDAIRDGQSPAMLCRLHGYWGERSLEGSIGQGDTGAVGSDAFKWAETFGMLAEDAWPYVWDGQEQDRAPAESVFDPKQPPRKVEQEMAAGNLAYKLEKPYAAPPRSQLAFQQVLSNGQSIAFGFTVYESFESSEVAKTGVVPMPGQDEQQLGGHEVLIVGYLKSEPTYALVRNSWGADWGLGGYFLMPWSYLLDPNLAGDWTTIQRPVGK